MRFLRRYNKNMLQLVSSSPKAKTFWALEFWKTNRPRKGWECKGSLDILDRELGGRHLLIGFGTLFSLRYLEAIPSRYLQLWIGHRSLVACRDRSGI